MNIYQAINAAEWQIIRSLPAQLQEVRNTEAWRTAHVHLARVTTLLKKGYPLGTDIEEILRKYDGQVIPEYEETEEEREARWLATIREMQQSHIGLDKQNFDSLQFVALDLEPEEKDTKQVPNF